MSGDPAAANHRHPLDWRGTPITPGCRVLFPRPWGKNAHSTEIVEADVDGFTPTGRIRVEIIATSRERPWTGQKVYAVPPHSVTVIPANTDMPADHPGVPASD